MNGSEIETNDCLDHGENDHEIEGTIEVSEIVWDADDIQDGQ